MRSPRLSPRLARAVRGTGVVLVITGVVVLLFVGYQLWGTGIQHSRAQAQLEDEFQQRLDAAEDVAVSSTTTSTTAAPPATSTTSATTTTTALPPEVVDDLAAPADGDPIARLEIPAIGVDEIVVQGVGVADLRKGPGHYPTSSGFGEPGNAAIAGHRTTYGQPFFDLDRVQPGDEIILTTLRGTFTYEVMGHPDPAGGPDAVELGHFIVGAGGVEVLDDMGDDRLTLTACHPKFSSRQRIVVTALLVDDPIEPLPRREPDEPTEATPTETADDEAAFGDGIEGDAHVLVPMLVWSGLFVVGMVAAVVVGARWRRWPTYLIAAPFLLVTLWFAFENIDRYLPAY